ncbi:variant leucine-rich repeat-containing protein [Pseudoclavibacter sp. 8L]
MTDADRDRIATRTIGTPPQLLTDIAMRRPDLRPSITLTPGATPELLR